MALQNAAMRKNGIAWEAEKCRDPRACEDGLCVPDWANGFWHPVDPLAFAKWRIRANPADIPPHVFIRHPRSRVRALRDFLLDWGMVVGTVGVATIAGVLTIWVGRHGRAEPACPT